METVIARAGWIFLQTVFAVKYGSRLLPYPLLWAIATPLVMIAGFALADRSKKANLSRRYIAVYATLSLALALVVIWKVDPETLQVDRWSVVDSFWRATESGNYPYHARSHLDNPPGPLPGYFGVLWPFWKFNLLAVFSVLGGILGLMRNPFRATLWAVSSSLFLLWEFITQSNLFTFTLLTLMYLSYIYKNTSNFTLLRGLGIGILGGILLNTRSIMILAYIVYLPFLWNLHRMRLLPILTGILMGFIAPLLLLYLSFPTEFTTSPPWDTQTTELLPPIYGLVFMGLAFAAGFAPLKALGPSTRTGLTYFIAMLIYTLHHAVQNGWNQVIWEGGVDWSYFIFATAFFIPSIKKR